MNLEAENTDWIQNRPLLINDVIELGCVGCGKKVQEFNEETNNCCDECWLIAEQITKVFINERATPPADKRPNDGKES